MTAKETLIEAFNRGYRVASGGSVLGKQVSKLSTPINSAGYYFFSIRKGSKKYVIQVHRLQAFQKYGMQLFDTAIVVRHLNGNPLDNSYDNIVIGTQSDNMLDIPEEVRVAKALHASSFVRKHKKEIVRKFHKNNGNSYKKTMEHFCINSKGTLHYILNS